MKFPFPRVLLGLSEARRRSSSDHRLVNFAINIDLTSLSTRRISRTTLVEQGNALILLQSFLIYAPNSLDTFAGIGFLRKLMDGWMKYVNDC